MSWNYVEGLLMTLVVAIIVGGLGFILGFHMAALECASG